MDLSVFNIGDKVLPDQYPNYRVETGPSRSVFKKKSFFFVYGVGDCDHCDDFVWAKVYIKNQVFYKAIAIFEPKNYYSWSVCSFNSGRTARCLLKKFVISFRLVKKRLRENKR